MITTGTRVVHPLWGAGVVVALASFAGGLSARENAYVVALEERNTPAEIVVARWAIRRA